MHVDPTEKSTKIPSVLGNRDAIFFDAASQNRIIGFAATADI